MGLAVQLRLISSGGRQPRRSRNFPKPLAPPSLAETGILAGTDQIAYRFVGGVRRTHQGRRISGSVIASQLERITKVGLHTVAGLEAYCGFSERPHPAVKLGNRGRNRIGMASSLRNRS